MNVYDTFGRRVGAHRRVRSLVAIAAAAVLLSAGAAAATTIGLTSKSTTISGCENTKTGSLTVLLESQPKCPRGTKALSWNTTGPKGSTGAAGPSASYFHEDLTTHPFSEETTISSLTLPAGSYTYAASLLLTSSAGVNCDLVDHHSGLVLDNADAQVGTMTLSLVGASVDPGAVSIGCSDSGSGTVSWVSFVATRTGSLKVQA
jgi:hypothetical protein